MTRMSRSAKHHLYATMLAGCAAACTLGFSESAEALPFVDVGASARILYGSPTEDLSVNPYGLGVGLRGGFTVLETLYLGVNAEIYFGETGDLFTETSSRVEAKLLGGRDEAQVSRSSFVAMAEVGYDFSLVALTVRPLMGFGLLNESAEACTTDAASCLNDSSSRFGISPGIQVLASPGFFKLTAEARYLTSFEDNDSLTFGVGIALEF